MEGALIYLAMGYPEKMGDPNNMTSKNYAYIIGLLLPDIVKSGFIKTKEDFDKLFEKCEEKDILTYEQFIEYSKDPHFTDSIRYFDNPNLRRYIECKFVNLRNPLWQGVFCHLIGDKMFYDKDFCINQTKIKEDFKAEKLNDEQWKNSKTANAVHGDYKLLDIFIQKNYPIMKYLTPELKKLFKIEASNSEKNSRIEQNPKYMNLNNIWNCIKICRNYARTTDIKREEDVVRKFEKWEKKEALRKSETAEGRE